MLPQSLILDSRSPNVRLIGPARIETGSLVTAGFRSGRVPALLAYLCLRSGVEIHREEIAEALWPRLLSEAARNNLRVTLRYLKQALSAHGLESGLRTDDRFRLLLDAEIVVSDVALFERLGRRGRDEEALALAGAGFLPGVQDEWVVPHRTAFEAARAEILDRLAERLLPTDPERAVEYARRALADDPLSNAARGLVARAALQRGDAYAALRELTEHRNALQNELGEPLPPALEALLDQARRGASPATATTVPIARTRFYGREEELAAVEAWIGSGDRLMTIFGPGGIGKSRLGMEAVSRHAGDAPVLWVDATGATSADGLLDLTVARLGPIGPVPGSAFGQIVSTLHGRRTLLVLDNLEAVPDEDLTIVDALLDRLSLAQALCLSRKTLGLAGERTLRLDPLPLPKTVDDRSAPALALFLDRASGIDGDADLVALAHELEGIPLAIELAAAKTATLTVPELLAGMHARLDVLVARSSKHARHRTMRSTLDWSFDLLEPAMRDALLDLAVFRNGWTMDAAHALSGHADLSTTREVLETGCTNSLLIRSAVDGESRYRMLQCTRDYAMEILTPSRCARLRARHADYYVALAGRGLPIGRLEREESNLRAALETLAESPGEGEVLTGFGEALIGYWTETSAGRPALRVLETLDRTGLSATPLARLCLLESRLRFSISDFENALACADAGLAASSAKEAQSPLQSMRSRIFAVLGRLEEASQAALDAVSKAEGESPETVAEALLARRFVEVSTLDPAALDTTLQAVAATERGTDIVLLGRALDTLGLLYFQLGDLRRAEAAFARSEGLPLEPTPVRQAQRWLSRAQIAVTAGNLGSGRMAYAKALEFSRASGHPWWLCQALAQLGDTDTKLGQFADARRAHQEAYEIRLRTHETSGIASCLRGLGMASHGLGEHERALRELSEARRIAEETRDEFFLSTVLLPLAQAAREAGHRDEAKEALNGLFAVCERLGQRPELARELDLEGACAEAQAMLAELDH